MSRTAGLSSNGRALLAHAVALAAELEALRAEVRRVLRFSRSHGPNREYIVQFGAGIKPYEVPLIAALLRDEGT